ILPTPMATCQRSLPLAVACYAPDGTELLRKPLGNLPRRGVPAVAIGDLLGEALQGLPYGHLELLYDFSQGGEADGWLHGLFRYEDIATGHQAETSFGAHIFNTVVTYRDEPQSYTGKAPGLSTRLFLRLGNGEIDTLCHLIYPASAVWHTMSATQLQLHNAAGELVVGKPLAIPCGGSVLWRYHDLFSRAERAAAGEGAYLVVRDTTCRLFGYHGLEHPGGAFSFDHMFGF
ncbi:MAG TPA: hypothetical protein VEI97_12475, partial [bacterium]|nr:hypothetical protein [bacterium]